MFFFFFDFAFELFFFRSSYSNRLFSFAEFFISHFLYSGLFKHWHTSQHILDFIYFKKQHVPHRPPTHNSIRIYASIFCTQIPVKDTCRNIVLSALALQIISRVCEFDSHYCSLVYVEIWYINISKRCLLSALISKLV